MHYLGGKSRLAGRIANILNDLIVETRATHYYEPFVGAANIVPRIVCINRHASDIHSELIEMWKAAQAGWVPPSEISEQMYQAAKLGAFRGIPHLVAFAGFGCAFGGKWWGGYARSYSDGKWRNYALGASDSILRKAKTMQGVEFQCQDYRALQPPAGSVIYCDPPYIGTTGYKGTGHFDHDEFWSTVRTWSESSRVVVSEYVAPADFSVAAEFGAWTTLNSGASEQEARVERLFTLAPSPFDRLLKLVCLPTPERDSSLELLRRLNGR